MSEWKPIETAPKDGTTILAWGRYSDMPFTVRWKEKDWQPVWDGWPVIQSAGDSWTEYHSADPISHWMPLPAPPEPSVWADQPYTTKKAATDS